MQGPCTTPCLSLQACAGSLFIPTPQRCAASATSTLETTITRANKATRIFIVAAPRLRRRHAMRGDLGDHPELSADDPARDVAVLAKFLIRLKRAVPFGVVPAIVHHQHPARGERVIDARQG